MKTWVLSLFAAIGVSFAADPNVVFQDDFETDPSQSPPSGWSMWGTQEYKVAANFMHDSANPHTGQSCFRIFHPANTRGYIMLSPARAIHPKPDMVYTFSFWARADKAAKATFGLTSYRSIKPFADDVSAGSFELQVGNEWKQFTFSVREGLDLFASRSRYLLMSFDAAHDRKEQRTLWIDDVHVSEQLDPNPVRLLDDTAVVHPPLEHRLRPGAQLELTLDPNKRLRRATQEAGGVSFHRVCGWTGQPYNKKGEYTLAPELETAIREMRLPMTRFYAVGDEPFGVEPAIDRVAEMCRKVGIGQEHCVIEFERQGAETKLSPEDWSRGVRYSLQHGYNFHHWEIANEPYAVLWGNGGAFPTAESFVDHFRAVSRAVRQADAKAQIGLDCHPTNVRWGNYLLKQLAGDYDFIAGHYYSHTRMEGRPLEELALTENYRTLSQALINGALARAYNPQRQVYQYDTEWGLACSTPDGKEADDEPRNANIIGTLHRAVRLIYCAREDILRGASGWQMFSNLRGPGFGILSQEAADKRFMLYWLYYYFNRHVGEWALDIDGTAPFHQPEVEADRELLAGPLTPVLATASNDGKTIWLVIANGSSSRTVPCRARLRDFRIGGIHGVVLSSDAHSKPLLNRKEDFVADFPVLSDGGEIECGIPPHAVVFLTLRAR